MLLLNDIIVHEKCESSNIVNDKGFDNIELLVSIIDIWFESTNEIKTFYRQYAIRKGFGIRTRLLKKGTDNQIKILHFSVLERR